MTGYIEDRLSELEEEKSELKKYQKFDTERRCVEYAMYDRERKEAEEKLDIVDQGRGATITPPSPLHHSMLFIAQTNGKRQLSHHHPPFPSLADKS